MTKSIFIVNSAYIGFDELINQIRQETYRVVMAVEGRGSALLQACLELGGDLVASVEFLKS